MVSCTYRIGLFSILFILVSGGTGLAASMGEQGTIQIPVNRESIHHAGTLGKGTYTLCKHMEKWTGSGLLTTGEDTCSSNLSNTRYQEDVGVHMKEPSIIEGNPHQLKFNAAEYSQCLFTSQTVVPSLEKHCQTLGVPWLHPSTEISAIQETFPSLYEFELPVKEWHHNGIDRSNVSFSDRQFNRNASSVFAEGHKDVRSSHDSASLEVLAFQQEEGTRSLVFWAPDHQVEVSNTMTKFIPKAPVQTRNVEWSDLLYLFLLLLLLPDYQKWRSLLGKVWEKDPGKGKKGIAFST